MLRIDYPKQKVLNKILILLSLVVTVCLLGVYGFTGNANLIRGAFFMSVLFWLPPILFLIWAARQGYLRIENDKLTRYYLIPKSVELNENSRIQKLANDYIICSGSKKLTVNADYFTPETERQFLKELKNRGIEVENLNERLA